MDGARLLQIRVTPRTILKFRRLGKKTSGSLGGPADQGSRGRAASADHVPRRGSFRADGTDSTLLVAGAVASDGGQRLRTAVYLCLRRGQPDRGRTGLEDKPPNEHRANEPISGSNQSGASRGIHRYGCGRSQFPPIPGTRDSGKHPPAYARQRRIDVDSDLTDRTGSHEL